MLKRLLSGLDSTADELAVHQFLQSDDLALHPDNHTAFLLDVLQVPDGEMEHIVVLPLLRPHNNPEFETTAEVVDFIEQILKGLRFMHTNGVAHGRWAICNNIMMDATAMYPAGFHPGKTRMRPDMSGSAAYYSRSQRPVTYYFTDFREARRYPTEAAPLVSPSADEDRIEPEHEGPLLARDPFAADIYSMGKLLQTDFPNAHFLAPLIADMILKDPAARPSIDEVIARFADIRSAISPLQLALPILDLL
ncbi:hypothetical protein EWM64_g5104 [Hericium alpestre]|uniref:Protein kinase domain-containing protein n=1 Tax=Hericium alpestre TaxID=135208 RepID=A0A4Y9ZZG7_9AGAM|nr:hypothetical protein EWM64_g5104 [Hericium alpestre]